MSPPPVTPVTCSTCKFWVKENGWGQCHRYAPIPAIGTMCQSHYDHQEAEPVYPRTPEHEWCGDWVKA